MKKLYIFIAWMILSSCDSDSGLTDTDGDGVDNYNDTFPFNPNYSTELAYVAENGVTIIGSKIATPGSKVIINGSKYVIASENMLRRMVYAGEDLSFIITSQVTDMSGLFSNTWFVDGDFSHWDTSNVTTMASMFFDICGYLYI